MFIVFSNGKYSETTNWPLFTIDMIDTVASKAVQNSIYDACIKANTINLKMHIKE